MTAQAVAAPRVRRATLEAERERVQEIARLVRRSVEFVLRRRGPLRSWEVEDVSQQVLADLYACEGRALASWKEGAGRSFPSYVSLLARRSAISELRRPGHYPRSEMLADDASWVEALPAGAHGEEDRLAERMCSRAIILRLEAELSPLGRAMLVALYAEARTSTHEVASRVGKSSNSLHTWRRRIRKKARLLMSEP